MTSARITGQNHSVISYKLNGRKRFIVEKRGLTINRRIVNEAVAMTGREWSAVYNKIDEWISNRNDGRQLSDDANLCKTIEDMTY